MSEPDPKPIKRPETKRPFQFGLKSLFVVTLVWAVLCAIAVNFGVYMAISSSVLLLLWIAFWHRQSRSWAATAIVLLLLLGALLVPAYQDYPVASRRAVCSNNLEQLGLALHNYHNAYRCFPPAYIADESGRPMHSWRVLILPLIEEEQIFKAYSFNEPWDGPNNRKLAKHAVSAFRCPSDQKNLKDEGLMTSYVAVVGPDTAWPGSKCTKTADFGDGTASTILLIEVKDSGIHWMEPRDLDISQMAPGINTTSGKGISSNHPGGAIVVFADGHTRFVSEDVSPATIRALLTRNGGEEVDPDEF